MYDIKNINDVIYSSIAKHKPDRYERDRPFAYLLTAPASLYCNSLRQTLGGQLYDLSLERKEGKVQKCHLLHKVYFYRMFYQLNQINIDHL